MDRLESMQLFVRVVEMGSFSAVAKQLNVARSVVTRPIAALESHLGAKLLARSTRKLSLTGAGALYLEKCRVILNLVEAAETDLSENRGTPRGTIRVSAPLIYGVKRIAPLLLKFGQEFPEVHLTLDFNDRRTDLIEEGIDLSIRITERPAQNDIARKLGVCNLMVVAAPHYLKKHGTPEHPKDLARHRCLGYTLGDEQHGWPFIIEGHRESIYITSSLDANHGEVIIEASAQGMGIALQPDFIVEPFIAEKRVEQILESFAVPQMGVYAILPTNRLIPYRVRRLIDYLAEHLAHT